MPRVETASPATLTCELGPNATPFPLMMMRRPLDKTEPFNNEGRLPTSRFNTVLTADGWMKRVTSPVPLENDCQLITVLPKVVTFKVLPTF